MVPSASQEPSAVPDSTFRCIGDGVPPDFAPLIAPHWRQFQVPSPVLHYVLGSIYIGFTVVSLSANGLVIAVYSCRHFRRPSNLFVLNLAICDFLMMLKTPIFIINSFHQGPYLGKIGCTIYGCVGALSGLGAIWFLAAIAYERYRAIKNPLDFQKRLTRSDAMKIIGAIWILSISFSVAPLFGWNRYVPEGYLTSCSFDYLTEEWLSLSFVIVLTIVAWLCPLIVIVYSYGNMIRCVRQNRRMLIKLNEHKPHPAALDKLSVLSNKYAQQNIEIKVAKVALILILMWVMSWTPYATVAMMGAFLDRRYLTPLSSMLPALACKTSACLNPVVYVFRNAKFQLELRRLFARVFQSKKSSLMANRKSDREMTLLHSSFGMSFIKSKSITSSEIF